MVSPQNGDTRGGPPPASPPSDATVYYAVAGIIIANLKGIRQSFLFFCCFDIDTIINEDKINFDF